MNYFNKNMADQTGEKQEETLTHIDQETNLPKQVDVSEKLESIRVATASGFIQLDQKAYDALSSNSLKKGNALVVAQLAGIQASKQTANLIPLCHQVQLDVCKVDFRLDAQKRRVICETMCKTSTSKTGVEMEALTACSLALLTIYDMCKAVQKDAIISEIKLESKSGGKSDFTRSR